MLPENYDLHEIAWKILENGDVRRRKLPDPITYGIVSAYIKDPSADNQKRHQELLQDIISMGYHPKEIRGLWDGKWERSAFISNIKFEELLQIAIKFDQKAVIYKDDFGPQIIRLDEISISAPPLEMMQKAELTDNFYLKNRPEKESKTITRSVKPPPY
jgi:hypothetical protein